MKTRIAVVIATLLMIGLPTAGSAAPHSCALSGKTNPLSLSTTASTQDVTYTVQNTDCPTIPAGLILKAFFDISQMGVTAASAAGSCHIAHAHGVAKCVLSDALAAGQAASMTITMQVVQPSCTVDPLVFRTKDPSGIVGRTPSAPGWSGC
jgi:hypothetical protein